MSTQTKVQKVFRSIKRSDYILEDRREYDENDLAKAYDLTEDEAHLLFQLIQAQFAR